MAVIVNDRDIALQATNPRLVSTTVIIVSEGGAIFHKPADPAPITPDGITLRAVYTVFQLPTITWEYSNNVDLVWVPLGTGETKAISAADFETHVGTGNKVKYRCTATQLLYASAESPTFEVTYTKAPTGEGGNGRETYHIELDIETRFVMFSTSGVPKAGQLPVQSTAIVRKGPGGTILSNEFVTYSIDTAPNSVSGVEGYTITPTGNIQISLITQPSNYVTIKAVVAEPNLPELILLKKLYIYKIKDTSIIPTIDVTQDHYFFEYADNASSTNISPWTSINFVAKVQGYSNPVITWSVKTFNNLGAETTAGHNYFTSDGNLCVVSAAQFIQGGINNVARMEVYATVSLGGVSYKDYAVIYRKDGTGGSIFLLPSNINLQYTHDTNNTVTTTALQEESSFIAIVDLSGDNVQQVNNGWTITATSLADIDIKLNDAVGPFVCTDDDAVELTITRIAVGTLQGTIILSATKESTTLSASIVFNVSAETTGGAILSVDPDGLILLPIGSNREITGYSTANRTVKVLRGATDDSANWTFSKEDGPGVISTLVDGVLSVTNFTAGGAMTGASINWTEISSYVFTENYTDLYSSAYTINYETNTIVVRYEIIELSDPDYNYGIAKLLVSTNLGVSWQVVDPPRLPRTAGITYGEEWSYVTNGPYYSPYHKKYFMGASRYDGTQDLTYLYYSSDGISWTLSAPTVGDYNVYVDGSTDRIYYSNSVAELKYTTAAPYTSFTNITPMPVHDNYPYFYGNNISTNTPLSTFIPPMQFMYKYDGHGYTAGSWKSDVLTNILPEFYPQWPAAKFVGGFGNIALLQAGDDLNPRCFYKPVTSNSWTQLNFGNSVIFRTAFNYYNSAFHFYKGTKLITSYRDVSTSTYRMAEVDIVGTRLNTYSMTGDANIANPDGSINNFNSIVQVPNKTAINLHTSNNLILLIEDYDNKNIKCYRGVLSGSSTGNDAYIKVIATSNDASLGALETTVTVRKSSDVGETSSVVLSPSPITLNAMSTGEVYQSSLSGSNNVSFLTVYKNGQIYYGTDPYFSILTGAGGTTTGITAVIENAGSGAPTGARKQVRITAMTANAVEPAEVKIHAAIPGDSSARVITLPVRKLRDNVVPGIDQNRLQAPMMSISGGISHVYFRLLNTGELQLKEGTGGIYRNIGAWYNPVRTTSPLPGSSWYVTVGYTSTTGDILVKGTGVVNNPNSNIYELLSSSKEWYLTSTVPGEHTVNIIFRFSNSSTGTSGIIVTGSLTLYY